MQYGIDNLCQGGHWYGKVDQAVIDACELLLGISFPEDYRRFLLDFGCGSKNGIEIAGLGSPSFFSDANVMARTILKQRSYNHYPKKFIFFSETGDGCEICFDPRDWSVHEIFARPPKDISSVAVASNFLEFLKLKFS